MELDSIIMGQFTPPCACLISYISLNVIPLLGEARLVVGEGVVHGVAEIAEVSGLDVDHDGGDHEAEEHHYDRHVDDQRALVALKGHDLDLNP